MLRLVGAFRAVGKALSCNEMFSLYFNKFDKYSTFKNALTSYGDDYFSTILAFRAYDRALSCNEMSKLDRWELLVLDLISFHF